MVYKNQPPNLDYRVHNEDVEYFVKKFELEGKKIKLNLDGLPNRSQFNPYIKKRRMEQYRSEDTPLSKHIEEAEEKFKGTVLTDEKLAEIKEKVRTGELSMEEFKKVSLFKYKDDPLFMATHLFRDMTLSRATGTYTPSPAFHQEVLDSFLEHRFVATAAPRGHAKSTLTGFFYVLHQALFEKKKNIVIVSSTEDLAIRFLRDVKTECEVNKQLIWLFGQQKSSKWSEKEIQLANGCRIYAKGRGGQMRGLKERGTRPDLIICDDLEDSELVRSELRRLDLEDWFNGDVLPTLEPKIGQLIFIGTILHEDSLLNRVLDNELYPDFTTHIYRAIIEDEEGNERPLWPERFSLEDLNSIKQSYLSRGQLSTFFMEYMNDPMPSEGATFRSEYFQYFDQLPDTQMVKEIFVDLGGGGLKKTADDTAMLVLATDVTTGDIYVEDYVAEKMGTDTDKMLGHLLRLADMHQVNRVFIEKSVATNMIRAALERKMKSSRIHLRIEYLSSTRGSADRRGTMSDGKFQRIATMEAPFKLGVIKMRKWMTKMQEQLLAFPRGKHDDLIDALAYGYMYGKKQRKNSKKHWRPRHRGGYLNR